MLTAILRVPALRLAMMERENIWPALRLPSVRVPAMHREHWAATFVLSLLLGLYLLAGLNLIGVPDGRAAARSPADLPAAVRGTLPPAPEPMKFVEMAPQDAVALNASVPLSALPNPAARAFNLLANGAGNRERALQCLTQAVYYEAAIEPLDGQRAVAQVVLNRLRHPAYPKTVCGVVYQGSDRSTGCQFTFTCDGSLARAPSTGLWRQARQIAEAALAGKVYKPVGWATHYHTNWVVPYWSSSLVKAAVVGTHIFYRWTGGWGTGPAFTGRYAGIEPDVSSLGRHTAGKSTDALAAVAAGAMTPEQLALAEKLPDGTVVPGSSMDSFQRAVLRRYEPMPGSAVTAILASQAKSEGKAGTAAMRWALAGDGAGPKVAPLGKAVAAAPVPAKKTEPTPSLALPADVAEKAAKEAAGPSAD